MASSSSTTTITTSSKALVQQQQKQSTKKLSLIIYPHSISCHTSTLIQILIIFTLCCGNWRTHCGPAGWGGEALAWHSYLCYSILPGLGVSIFTNIYCCFLNPHYHYILYLFFNATQWRWQTKWRGCSLVPPVDNAGWNQEGRRIESPQLASSQQHNWRQHWPVSVPVLLLLLCQETRKSVRTKERWALYLYQ